MIRSSTERLAEKTSERQFLYELETDFELAPATSRAVLETAGVLAGTLPQLSLLP